MLKGKTRPKDTKKCLEVENISDMTQKRVKKQKTNKKRYFIGNNCLKTGAKYCTYAKCVPQTY